MKHLLVVILCLLSFWSEETQAQRPPARVIAVDFGEVSFRDVDGSNLSYPILGLTTTFRPQYVPGTDDIIVARLGSPGGLFRFNSPSTVPELVLDPTIFEGSFRDFSIDYDSNTVYWSEREPSSIRSASLLGDGTATTIYDETDGLNFVDHLKFSPETGHFYWYDLVSEEIFQGHLDGRPPVAIYSKLGGDFDGFESLTLAPGPTDRLLLLANASAVGFDSLYEAPGDGSTPPVELAFTDRNLTQLDFSETDNALIVASGLNSRVLRFDLGTGMSTVLHQQPEITVFANSITVDEGTGRVLLASTSAVILGTTLSGGPIEEVHMRSNAQISNTSGVTYDPIDDNIYWSSATGPGINRVPREGGDVESIFGEEQVTRPECLRLDDTSGTLFWIDETFTGDPLIVSGPKDGGPTTILYSLTNGLVDSLRDLAIDRTRNLLFWSSDDQNQIFSGSFDGTQPPTVLYEQATGSFEEVIALAVDEENGEIYWTDLGDAPTVQPSISKGNVDGTAPQQLVYEFPGDDEPDETMAFEPVDQRLYFNTFGDEDYLRSTNLEGQDVTDNFEFASRHIHILPAGDFCLADPDKLEEGICGCGVPDVDRDGDGTFDCLDQCPEDALKTEPLSCGCGETESCTCTAQDLSSAKLEIDGAALGLMKVVRKSLRARKRLSNQELCEPLPAKRQRRTLARAESLYAEMWTTAWSELPPSEFSCDLPSVPSDCTGFDATTDKTILQEGYTDLRNLVTRSLRGCGNSRRARRLRNQATALVAAGESALEQLPDTILVCD